MAAKYGDAECVDILMKGGASADIADCDGKTALAYAEEDDQDEVQEWGTDPNDVDTDDGGRTDGDEVYTDGTDPLDESDDLSDRDGDGLPLDAEGQGYDDDARADLAAGAHPQGEGHARAERRLPASKGSRTRAEERASLARYGTTAWLPQRPQTNDERPTTTSPSPPRRRRRSI